MAEIAGQSPLERAAQAIRITLHLATNSEREAADRAARAALEAIREPSEKMLWLVDEMAGNGLAWDANTETVTEVWQALLDAALAE